MTVPSNRLNSRLSRRRALLGNCKDFTPLLTATAKDVASAYSFAASQKTVGSFSSFFAALVCSFHVGSPFLIVSRIQS